MNQSDQKGERVQIPVDGYTMKSSFAYPKIAQFGHSGCGNIKVKGVAFNQFADVIKSRMGHKTSEALFNFSALFQS